MTQLAKPILAWSSTAGLGLAGTLAWCVMLVVSGCSRPAPTADPDVIARIGRHEVRTAEFREWMQRRHVGDDPRQKEALLQEILLHHAQLQQAETLGLDRDPGIRRTWDNLLISRLRERELESLATNDAPTRTQLAAYYETNRAGFTEAARRQGAILFAESPARTSPTQHEAIRQRLTEARAKAWLQLSNEPTVRGFGALAVEYSEDQVTRYRGGDFGWLIAGNGDNRFDPQVPTTLFSLTRTNPISEVLETPRGYYVVKLLDERPAQTKSFAAVEPALNQKLLVQNRQRRESNWHAQLRATFPAQVFTNALEGIVAPRKPPSNPADRPPPLP